MNLLFRLLPAEMSSDGFTCGNKTLDAPQTGGMDWGIHLEKGLFTIGIELSLLFSFSNDWIVI